jgi:hypothetical protein
MCFHLHKHEWEEINRQFGEIETYSPPISGSKLIGRGDPFTLITYKCKTCPKYHQEHLEGTIVKTDGV